MVFYDGSPDVVYIVYGADRYLEFKHVEGTEYAGVNGCAGVVTYVAGAEDADPDWYIYYDQHGVATYFFGGTNTGNAAWQIWKIVDPAGNVAYVGDASTAATALSNGYTADGGIALGVGSERQWPRFCAAIGLPDLATDPRFATNGDRVVHHTELRPILAERFARSDITEQEYSERIDVLRQESRASKS